MRVTVAVLVTLNSPLGSPSHFANHSLQWHDPATSKLYHKWAVRFASTHSKMKMQRGMALASS